MTDFLIYEIHGDPAPQGSKRAYRNEHSGKIQLIESSARVAPWRQDVRHVIERDTKSWWQVTDGPVRVEIIFAYDRPKGHYRTGAYGHLLRADAPNYPTGKVNDLDKLVRSTLDAIGSTGRVFGDDGQVVQLDVMKTYVDHPFGPDKPGASIRIWRLT